MEIAACLVKALAAWHRDRSIHVVADAAYHGPALRHLPARSTAGPRLPASAMLYVAPPPTDRRGQPRLKGGRMGAAPDVGKTVRFTILQIQTLWRTGAVWIAEIRWGTARSTPRLCPSS